MMTKNGITMQIHRREFIGAALSAMAGLGSIPHAQAQGKGQCTESIPKPCPPSAWRKHGIIIEGTEPWETGQVANFLCPAEPLDGNRWRIWYYSVGPMETYTIGYAEGVPGEPMKKHEARLSPGEPADVPFAIGNLPENWRPSAVNHIRLKNGKHRIYFWVYDKGIHRYLAADSDDGRRYRVLDPHRPILYHFNDRAAQGVHNYEGVFYPPKGDGKRPADEPAAPPHLICNDVVNIYPLPDGTFEIYATTVLRVPEGHARYNPNDNKIGALRLIDRFTSPDGLHFENRRRAIEWDADDPIDQQFYYLAVTHTPKGRVGMAGHYRSMASTMDIEWCFSTDGVTWHRPYRRAWIHCGNYTQPDSFGIYGPHGIVHHQGRYHLFYTGVNGGHNGIQTYGLSRSVIMYATTASIWA